MERLQRIKDKLLRMGEDYDSLKPFLVEYLDNIEALVEKQEHMQCEAVKALKDNVLTPVSVAQELGCSRTTLYNHNQILKRYIEYSAELLDEQNPLRDMEISEHKLQMLREQVFIMEIRDIKNEQLQHECKALSDLLRTKSDEIGRLQNRIMELTAELSKYKRKSPKDSSST